MHCGGWKMKQHIQAGMIILVLATCVLPVRAEAAEPKIGMQDTFLLMVASHQALIQEDGDFETHESEIKVASPVELLLPSKDDTLSENEIDMLRQEWGEACTVNLARLKAHFTGQQECELVAMMEAACAKQRNWLNEQAEELARVRRRRARNRGLQGVFRRIGRAIRNADPNQAVRWFGREVVKEVAKSAVTGGVALKRKVIIQLGRQIFKKKLQNEIVYSIQRNQTRRREVTQDSGGLNLILRRAETQFDLTADEIQAIKNRCGERESSAQNDSGCGTDGAWIDAYWENVVITRLKEDFKHCSNTDPYLHCLEQQAAVGLCEDEAHVACKETYDALWAIPPGPIALGNANVTTPTQNLWESFTFQMSFDGRGGAVNGSHEHEQVYRKDTTPCTTTLKLEFSGTFSPSTCLMEGNLTRTLTLSQPGVAGPCWSLGCDFGHEGCTHSDVWAMKIYDGRLLCVQDVGQHDLCSLEISLTP